MNFINHNSTLFFVIMIFILLIAKRGGYNSIVSMFFCTRVPLVRVPYIKMAIIKVWWINIYRLLLRLDLYVIKYYFYLQLLLSVTITLMVVIINLNNNVCCCESTNTMDNNKVLYKELYAINGSQRPPTTDAPMSPLLIGYNVHTAHPAARVQRFTHDLHMTVFCNVDDAVLPKTDPLYFYYSTRLNQKIYITDLLCGMNPQLWLLTDRAQLDASSYSADIINFYHAELSTVANKKLAYFYGDIITVMTLMNASGMMHVSLDDLYGVTIKNIKMPLYNDLFPVVIKKQ